MKGNQDQHRVEIKNADLSDFLIQNNLASQRQVEANETRKPSKAFNLANYEEHVLDHIDQINEDWKNPERVLMHLKHLQHIFMIDIPLSFRPALFSLLNNLSSALMNGYNDNETIFRASFAVMTQFKIQVDSKPQSDEALAESEWHEFERCVYTMSDWQDLIEYGNEVVQVPLHAEK